ncbi:MAG TPA: DUF6263 family protein [Planctomycetaceae bacterium]|nr:DUF6263 family protein [Planctomycetaceae bacterium]
MAIVALGSLRAPAEEAVLLRYKMQPGESRVYRSSTELKQTQNLMGMALENVISGSDVTVQTLDKVDDDGNFHVQSENRRIQATMNIGPLGEYKFDSRSSEKDRSSLAGAALTPIYEALTGAVIQVTHTPRGEVTEVKGLKELIGDNLLKDNPFAAQAAAGATDEGAKITYGDRFVDLPEGPVKPGDTWEQPYEITLPGLGTAKGKSAYKFEGHDRVGDRATVKISVRDEMSFEVDLVQLGAKVTGSLSITSSSGTIQFDPEAGALVSKKSTQSLSGNLNVNANGQNIPIQQDQTQTTTVELLDKVPE